MQLRIRGVLRNYLDDRWVPGSTWVHPGTPLLNSSSPQSPMVPARSKGTKLSKQTDRINGIFGGQWDCCLQIELHKRNVRVKFVNHTICANVAVSHIGHLGHHHRLGWTPWPDCPQLQTLYNNSTKCSGLWQYRGFWISSTKQWEDSDSDSSIVR